jgi:hypothetical protein
MRVIHDNAGPEKELRFLRYQIPTQDFKLTVIVKDKKILPLCLSYQNLQWNKRAYI